MVDTAASYEAGVKLVQTRRMLRYAAHFHKKIPKKIFKKIFKKKFQKKFQKILKNFEIFL
jgi:hypothetical protein